jgi:probable HAF family extracellular repeat protein
VGSSQSSNGIEAFRWTESEGIIPLGDLPGSNFFSIALGTSSNGSVVVGHSNSEGVFGEEGIEAFYWTESDEMVGMGIRGTASDISSDGSIVVGGYQSNNYGNEAFIWTESAGIVDLGVLQGGNHSFACCITEDGSVIAGSGSSENTVDHGEAFRWTETEGMVGLGDLPGGEHRSTALSVTADGSIVVGHATSGVGSEAFIWDRDNGMRSLNEVIVDDYGINLNGWFLIGDTKISSDGRIITGMGINPDGNHEAWIAKLSTDLWHVNDDIAVSGNGKSWAEAFKTIQEAIDAADDGDVIWVTPPL